MKIRFRKTEILDLNKRKKILSEVNSIMLEKDLILGSRVRKIEKDFSKFLNCKYSILTGSGTDSIYLALQCLNLKKDDEIITTPLSWVTSSSPILLNNLKPVFVDIDNDLNIDSKKIIKKISKKTKAILLVHYTGLACNMSEIVKIAKKYNLKIIEDSSQAFGSKYKDKFCGTFGEFGCFSLNPVKNLSAYGEAGLIVTNNKRYYKKLLMLRYAGTKNKEYCYFPGLNFKPDTIQVPFLNLSLKNINNKITSKQNIAKHYLKHIKKKYLLNHNYINRKIYHTYYSFIILSKERVKLIKYLNKNGVENKIEHPILIPNQVAFRKFKKQNFDLSNAKMKVKQILSIPIREDLKPNEVKKIINLLNNF